MGAREIVKRKEVRNVKKPKSNRSKKLLLPGFLFVGLLIFSGCDAQTLEADLAAAEAASGTTAGTGASTSMAGTTAGCSYVIQAVYDLGVSPTASFVSNNVSVAETIVQSTCSNITVGEERTSAAFSVIRQGTTIQVEPVGASAFSVSAGALTLSMTATSSCSSGTRTTETLLLGSLDPVGLTMTLDTEYTYAADTCGGTATPPPIPLPPPPPGFCGSGPNGSSSSGSSSGSSGSSSGSSGNGGGW